MLSPLYGQLSPLRVPTTDIAMLAANAYIAAVEAADGQSLESGVKSAFTDFIVGCHNDGIWTALKSSCILAGARTLSGALVPLAGTAPTNNNFVSADYNRETGLLGNGSTKYLNSNRSATADPQNNAHFGVFVSAPGVTGRYYLAQFTTSTTPIRYDYIMSNINIVIRGDSNIAANLSPGATGLIAASRSSSSQASYRINKNSSTVNNTSKAVDNLNLFIYARNINGSLGSGLSNGRLSFYSIGESINLAALDTRVSTLMTDLAAAI